MNYEELSNERKQFIDTLNTYCLKNRDICIDISNIFLVSNSWQGFRETVFKYLDIFCNEIELLRTELMKK